VGEALAGVHCELACDGLNRSQRMIRPNGPTRFWRSWRRFSGGNRSAAKWGPIALAWRRKCLADTRYITASAVQSEIRRSLEILETIENRLSDSTSGFRAKVRAHAKLLGLAIFD
jgi:hypothetical protein